MDDASHTIHTVESTCLLNKHARSGRNGRLAGPLYKNPYKSEPNASELRWLLLFPFKILKNVLVARRTNFDAKSVSKLCGPLPGRVLLPKQGGEKTVAKTDVRLGQGSYCLIFFDNRNSVVSAK